VPSWSAQHKYTLAGAGAASALLLESGTPSICWNETDAAVNNRAWDAVAATKQFQMRLVNDANNSATVWLQVDRTALVVDAITLAATNLAYNGIGTWAGIQNFTKAYSGTASPAIRINSASVPMIQLNDQAAAANSRLWRLFATGTQFILDASNDAEGAAVAALTITRAGAISTPSTLDTTGAITSGGVVSSEGVGSVRDIPRRITTFAAGQCTAVSAGITLNTADMATGRTFSLYNDSAADITITQGAGVTMRLGGTTTTGSRTLLARGFATIWCNSGTEAIVLGHVA
jgi:hypothetical protein